MKISPYLPRKEKIEIQKFFNLYKDVIYSEICPICKKELFIEIIQWRVPLLHINCETRIKGACEYLQNINIEGGGWEILKRFLYKDKIYSITYDMGLGYYESISNQIGSIISDEGSKNRVNLPNRNLFETPIEELVDIYNKLAILL